jgi:hypothetical protein
MKKAPKVGVMEWWIIGVLEHWSDRVMEYCKKEYRRQNSAE